MNAPYHHKAFLGAMQGLSGTAKRKPRTAKQEDAFDCADHLHSAVELYQNPDDGAEREALNAITCERPAYWLAYGYSAARCTMLVNLLNAGKPMGEALDEAYRQRGRDERLTALHGLVPLNRLAANDLSEAYEEFGLWRDATDLERRRTVDCRHAEGQRRAR